MNKNTKDHKIVEQRFEINFSILQKKKDSMYVGSSVTVWVVRVFANKDKKRILHKLCISALILG